MSDSEWKPGNYAYRIIPGGDGKAIPLRVRISRSEGDNFTHGIGSTLVESLKDEWSLDEIEAWEKHRERLIEKLHTAILVVAEISEEIKEATFAYGGP